MVIFQNLQFTDLYKNKIIIKFTLTLLKIKQWKAHRKTRVS